MSHSQAFVLPTMFPSNYMRMDIHTGPTPVNGFEMRERTSSTEKNYSREMSMSSTQFSIIYHERMANNGMDIDPEPTDNSPALSYEIDRFELLTPERKECKCQRYRQNKRSFISLITTKRIFIIESYVGRKYIDRHCRIIADQTYNQYDIVTSEKTRQFLQGRHRTLHSLHASRKF